MCTNRLRQTTYHHIEIDEATRPPKLIPYCFPHTLLGARVTVYSPHPIEIMHADIAPHRRCFMNRYVRIEVRVR